MTPKKKLGGFWRKVFDRRNSYWGVGKWAWQHYDPDNWWMDAWKDDGSWRYIHVEDKDKSDPRVYRLYPRERQGRRVTMGMKGGELYWIYSATKEEYDAWILATAGQA